MSSQTYDCSHIWVNFYVIANSYAQILVIIDAMTN